MTEPIRVAIVGMGRIAHEHHLPAIAVNKAFDLVATVSPEGGSTNGLPVFQDIDALTTSNLPVDAVIVCTPPQVRRAIAARALTRGWHVFLEKPPAPSLAESEFLRELSLDCGVTLFASWHSRYAAGVARARKWLAERTIKHVTIIWREDVRVWHPGQEWMWRAGGLGVFDAGINALSIATIIMPRPIFVVDAELDFPANLAAPIAARLSLMDTQGVPIAVDLDFRQEGPQSWDIKIETDIGRMTLRNGGADLILPGAASTGAAADLHGEYQALYTRFAELIRAGRSYMDVAPLRLVADSFLCGRQSLVTPFIE
ncbi:Gfo/Idh/MocA family protein [Sphingomonas tabacisoli]|uniref:Gfo/Idh/MocA family protein n=1 Tax=Sphingomonas tabacisoli TaxID=2249466 RepID=A0ABW4I3G3_9SPHN